MDIMYTDADGKTLGICKKSSLDVAFGTDENEIELVMPLDEAKKLGGNGTIQQGAFVFAPNTEYGGVIDSKGLNTTVSPNEMTFSGRSWHGIIEGTVIRPNSGSSHLVVSGECNEVLKQLITRQGIGDVFEVLDADSGVTINNYQFPRYIAAYTGIRRMLASVGMRLWISKPVMGKCQIQAVPAFDWSSGMDDNFVKFNMVHSYRVTNHLICLGSGEMQNRIVVDLYADDNGNISQKQTFFGIDEIAEVYDYSNADRDKLIENGTDKLKDKQVAGEVKVDVEDDSTFTVGDMVSSKSVEVDLAVSVAIVKIMAKIDERGNCTVSYKTGEEDTEEEYE